jgi:hypothetical protein
LRPAGSSDRLRFTGGWCCDWGAVSSRVVVAVGAESNRIMTGRSAVAGAERLGTTPVTFPGGHDGFLGGEYGRTGDPDAFATTLRKVLTD